MSKVLEIETYMNADDLAKVINTYYDNWSTQRHGWVEEKKELRNYIFATDTTKTTNSKLPWKNSTTLPVICAIRDRLHALYMVALGEETRSFFDWEAADEESDLEEKRKAIKAYVGTKWRDSKAWSVISRLVYDYIDYGVVYASVEPEFKYIINEAEEPEPVYVGPKVVRTDPLLHIVNPTAESYANSPKITRYTKSLGELIDDYEFKNDALKYDGDVIAHMQEVRRGLQHYNKNDVDRALAYQIEGFGSYHSYITSGYVELLEFEGDLYNPQTGQLDRNRLITVADRQWVLRNVPNPSWLPDGNRCSVTWRDRPDNIIGMGPLDNLVGMQYRIDHLENLKADSMDLIVLPPKKIRGDVEDFDWQPGEDIYVGIEGDVELFQTDLGAIIQAQNDIAFLADKMEESAGAPKLKSGFRTPGEKTAVEVQILQNNSDVLFKSKTHKFAQEVLEPLLNMFLELGVRYLNGSDIARTFDDDFAVDEFLEVTKSDITASGKLIAIGPRHFSEKTQLMNNVQQALAIGAGIPSIMNHVSGKKLAKVLFEDTINQDGIVKDNVGLMEAADTQRLMNTVQDSVMAESMTPTEDIPDENL